MCVCVYVGVCIYRCILSLACKITVSLTYYTTVTMIGSLINACKSGVFLSQVYQ